MKNRWMALIALPLLAAACARGGEEDAGAALVDTTGSATIVGDTTLNSISPMTTTAPAAAVPATEPADTTTAPAVTTDSAAPAADPHAAHGDSAAH